MSSTCIRITDQSCNSSAFLLLFRVVSYHKLSEHLWRNLHIWPSYIVANKFIKCCGTKLQLYLIFALLYIGLLIALFHRLITLPCYSLILFKNREFSGQGILSLTKKLDNFYLKYLFSPDLCCREMLNDNPNSKAMDSVEVRCSKTVCRFCVSLLHVDQYHSYILKWQRDIRAYLGTI